MTRIAAIDCGTNSIRLLVSEVGASGRLTDVLREMRIVRLGHGVDATGMLDPAALERTFAAASDYGELMRGHGVEAARFVATSATRDAGNREVFVEGIRAALGLEPEVISGDEEATLSFTGALVAVGGASGGAGVDDASAPAAPPSQAGLLAGAGATGGAEGSAEAGATARAGGLAGAGERAQGEPQRTIVDIGGGSTELVRGTRAPEAAMSLDMGCVRMTERHLAASLDAAGRPSPAAVEAARADVRALLAPALESLQLGLTEELVGLAGSVTTLTAHALGLSRYDRSRINGARLSVEQVLESCQEMLASTRAQREAMGFMHPARLDVIGAGAIVWSEVVGGIARAVAARGGQLTHVVTSEHDILDGIALSVAQRLTVA
ncbi:exopolyphosphatase [Buchananella felis]|uniref:Ppx/GppA phosphatase family protein n=1 Tax=Buchananella felis TaxID=3231492 RepID=UPI0035292AFD